MYYICVKYKKESLREKLISLAKNKVCCETFYVSQNIRDITFLFSSEQERNEYVSEFKSLEDVQIVCFV